MLAGLACGASKVIGIDKEEEYLELARRRIFGQEADPAVEAPRPTTVHCELLGGDLRQRTGGSGRLTAHAEWNQKMANGTRLEHSGSAR